MKKIGSQTDNCWDYVVVTVGTQAQKEMCELMCSAYKEKYSIKNLIFTADSDIDYRLGSGGALLNALKEVSKLAGRQSIIDKKILVINSGGMSKRAVSYAVRGKIFANISNDESGNALSLFDLSILYTSKLLPWFDAGVVVCCGDIPVDVGDEEFDFTTNVGFCVMTELSSASRHGVMISRSDGFLAAYPHKCEEAELKKIAQRYNLNDKLPVDTGTAYFCPEYVGALLKLIYEDALLDYLKRNHLEMSLYPDVIDLMSVNVENEKYLTTDNAKIFKIKELLYKRLHGFLMKVCVLNDRKFLHYGTLFETVENIQSDKYKKPHYFNSCVDLEACVGGGTVLDNAYIGAGCHVGERCIISDISLENVSINDETAVCGIKLCSGEFVAVVLSINENPKALSESGVELWKEKRFFKGLSFSDSYSKFICSDNCKSAVSMAYCVKNADCSYYLEWKNYLGDIRSFNPFSSVYNQYKNRVIKEYADSVITPKKLRCVKDEANISLPVRVNFSGTWTDAMPYCIDNKGRVINASVLIDGERPVFVCAKRIERKVIELYNKDSDEKIVIENIASLDLIDEFSSFNLHRAVLKVIGVGDKTELESGFCLTTEVRGIMKGSGLGTSSILLSGCFKVLGELFGIAYTDDEIINMVFIAEQIMKTGGGWQDQVGGFFCGIKDSDSEPGYRIRVNIKNIKVPDSIKRELSQRMAIISTCQRHYGRFVVSDVMKRYINKNADTLEVLKKLDELNDETAKCLTSGCFDGFVQCINKQWELLKKLSPMISNEKINTVANECLQLCDAVCICGAGAGGYLLAVLKDGVSIDDLKALFGGDADKVKKITVLFE